MGNELMLINSIEAMIEEYERRLGSMTSRFLSDAGRQLQRARDAETRYFQRLIEQGERWGEEEVRLRTMMAMTLLLYL